MSWTAYTSAKLAEAIPAIDDLQPVEDAPDNQVQAAKEAAVAVLKSNAVTNDPESFVYVTLGGNRGNGANPSVQVSVMQLDRPQEVTSG